MVSDFKTPILNCFYRLLWFYLLTDCESVAWPCWPSHVLCLAYFLCHRFLTNFIASKRVHMKCLVLSWGPESCQYSLKIIHFVYKPLDDCI